jgi:uncharacterized protein YukE
MSREEAEKTVAELRINIRQLREAVKAVLDDYEQTAQTLDDISTQVDGIETTDHSGDVDQLREDLIDALQSDTGSISPPWEREGYATKQAWLDASGIDTDE